MKKALKIVKTISILLVVLAVFLWLICSSKIHNFKLDNPDIYARNYSMMNGYEKAVATGMEKTGEVEKKVFGSKNKGKKDYDLFEDVSNRHKPKD